MRSFLAQQNPYSEAAENQRSAVQKRRMKQRRQTESNKPAWLSNKYRVLGHPAINHSPVIVWMHTIQSQHALVCWQRTWSNLGQKHSEVGIRCLLSHQSVQIKRQASRCVQPVPQDYWGAASQECDQNCGFPSSIQPHALLDRLKITWHTDVKLNLQTVSAESDCWTSTLAATAMKIIMITARTTVSHRVCTSSSLWNAIVNSVLRASCFEQTVRLLPPLRSDVQTSSTCARTIQWTGWFTAQNMSLHSTRSACTLTGHVWSSKIAKLHSTYVFTCSKSKISAAHSPQVQ